MEWLAPSCNTSYGPTHADKNNFELIISENDGTGVSYLRSEICTLNRDNGNFSDVASVKHNAAYSLTYYDPAKNVILIINNIRKECIMEMKDNYHNYDAFFFYLKLT
jgi:hypothetical protein